MPDCENEEQSNHLWLANFIILLCSLFSVPYTHPLLQANHAMSQELSPLFDLENNPALPVSPSLASSPSSLSSSKLKRLSLIAKPRASCLDIEREGHVSAAYVRSLTPTMMPSTSTNNPRRIRHSVIGNPAGITYSPSSPGTAGSPSASSMGIKSGESIHSSRGAYTQSPYGSSINVRHEDVEADRQRVNENEESQTLDPQTFMDRWFPITLI